MSDDQDAPTLTPAAIEGGDDDTLVRQAVHVVWAYAKANPGLDPDVQVSLGILCGRAMKGLPVRHD